MAWYGHLLVAAFSLGIICQAQPSSRSSRRTTAMLPRIPIRNDAILQPNELVNMLLTTGYSKDMPPIPDKPTEVKLGIYVNSLSAISEQDMEYTMSFYLRMNWRDPRLKFDPKRLGGRINQIRIGEDTMSDIWRPDVFFRNEKRATFHDVTTDNKFMNVNSTGFVWYVMKVTVTLSCPMKLQKFPHDTQTCPIMFESFGYTMDVLYFSWLESPVDIDQDMQLPQFRMQDKILYDCSQNYTGGAYPCLEIRLVLKRDIGHYILQYYIPTIFIVMLSWFAFWIDVRRVEARFTYGIINVLIMTMCMWGSNNASLARVSYVKAIDVWTFLCLLFLFAALLESAVISFLASRAKQGDSEKTEAHEDKVSSRVNTISKIAFPACFLLVNIIYWSLYA